MKIELGPLLLPELTGALAGSLGVSSFLRLRVAELEAGLGWAAAAFLPMSECVPTMNLGMKCCCQSQQMITRFTAANMEGQTQSHKTPKTA